MTEKQMTFDDVIEGARDQMIENAEYAKDFLNGMSRERIEEWMREQVHEIADSHVPVYNTDIFSVLSDPRVWSQEVADLGTPESLLQAAQWAIYMAIEERLLGDEWLALSVEDIANPD